MAIYDIIKFPHPVLTTPATPVTKITSNLLRVLDNMDETMRSAEGVGLAGPQVNIQKRIAVVDVEDGKGRLALINPVLIGARDEELGTEGCLSIPGIYGDVPRFKWIRVRMLDREGRQVEFEEVDFRARCIQHEMDHLDGILFTSKAVNLHRDEGVPASGKRNRA